MFGTIPLPPSWPVYVSHAEATAFARWAGKKLPSEAQWHRAAYGAPDGTEREYPWGEMLAQATRTAISITGDGTRPPWTRIPRARAHSACSIFSATDGSGPRRPFAPLAGIPAVFVLSRLLGQFLRRQAFRDEGRIAADGCVHVAPIVPQLVPAALPARVRHFPLRGGIDPWHRLREWQRQVPRPRRSLEFCVRRGGGTEPAGAERASFEIPVRRSRLGALRRDLPFAGIRLEPRGNAAARAILRRDRGAACRGRWWSRSSAAAAGRRRAGCSKRSRGGSA